MCRNRGSNTGPLDLQSNALPTELSQHSCFVFHNKNKIKERKKKWPQRESNPQSSGLESDALPLRHGVITCKKFRGSIVVSIPACHAGNPGSIPGLGAFFFFFFPFPPRKKKKKWRSRVSIPVPSACKADALPFELHPQVVNQKKKRRGWCENRTRDLLHPKQESYH